jgi:hypothetical protein
MRPIEFAEKNCVYAKDQAQYGNLPAYRTSDGVVISCWALTWRERIKLLFTGHLWCMVKTFNQPLQPMLLQTDKLFVESEKTEAGATDNQEVQRD